MKPTVLITTTINVPTVLTQWAASLTSGVDYIIVAGDKKSPHQEIRDLLIEINERFSVTTKYLHPNDQTHWATSAVTGWNCIQRRNIALLEAMRLDPEYIITVDDDNAPTSGTQIAELKMFMDHPEGLETVSNERGWWNAGVLCSAKITGDDDPYSLYSVVHRGFPLSERNVSHSDVEYTSTNIKADDDVKIGVAAMLWTGEPDIDAVERIVLAPIVISIERDGVVLLPGTWCPFNSQATMYRGELAPYMMVWPHVGRYDDIWASYLARRVMDHLGYSCYYGPPAVHQDRNEHNVINDLEQELFGMRHTDAVVQALRDVEFVGKSMHTILLECYTALTEIDVLPLSTREAFGAWLVDLATIKDERGDK